MALSFEILNTKIKDWATAAQSSIQATGQGMGITHRTNSPSTSPSLPKVRSKLLQDSVAVKAVAFTFPRSMVYTHTGAGKGQGGKKGSSWYTANGVRKRTNPQSLNKMNSGNRKAKPFIKQVLDSRVPVLANIVAQEGATIVTQNLFK